MKAESRKPTYTEQLVEDLKEKNFDDLDKSQLISMSQDIKNSYFSLQDKILSIRNNPHLSLDENKKQIKDTLIAFSGEILASLSCYKSPQKEVSIQDTPKEQQEPIKNKVRRNR